MNWDGIFKASAVLQLIEFAIVVIILEWARGILKAIRIRPRAEDAFPSNNDSMILAVNCSGSTSLWEAIRKDMTDPDSELYQYLLPKIYTAPVIRDAALWQGELEEAFRNTDRFRMTAGDTGISVSDAGFHAGYCYNQVNRGQGRALSIVFPRLREDSEEHMQQDCTAFRAVAEAVIRGAQERGVKSICLFFSGPLEMAYTFGAAAHNRMPLYLFHMVSVSERKYIALGPDHEEKAKSKGGPAKAIFRAFGQAYER